MSSCDLISKINLKICDITAETHNQGIINILLNYFIVR